MSETHLRNRLTDAYESCGYKVTNIENTHSSGTPDMNVQLPGLSFWLELKFLRNVATLATEPLAGRFVKPSQRLWLANHTRAGGESYVLLYVESVGTLFLVHGSNAYDCADWSWQQLPLLATAVIKNAPNAHERIIQAVLNHQKRILSEH